MTEAVAKEQELLPASPPLSRREFLYYLWGASMAVLLAGGGGAAIWFTLPRFREGEFGGVFSVAVADLPAPDTVPVEFPDGRFWLVHIGPQSMDDPRQPQGYPLTQGVRALFKVCTHLGCLYRWNESSDRFQCPCHGSKFLKTGTRVDGPARRNLDVFMVEAVDVEGNVLSRSEPTMGSDEGRPVEILPGTVALLVDTGRRVTGAPNSQPGGGI